jgi:hypothetical protein
VTYDEFVRRVHSAIFGLGWERRSSDGYVVRVHPEDWVNVRLTVPAWTEAVTSDSVLGLPVVRDSGVALGRIVLLHEVEA